MSLCYDSQAQGQVCLYVTLICVLHQTNDRSLSYCNLFKRLIIVTTTVPHHSLLQSYLVPHSLTSHNCNNILRCYYGIVVDKYCEQARKQDRRRASKQATISLFKTYVTSQLKLFLYLDSNLWYSFTDSLVVPYQHQYMCTAWNLFARCSHKLKKL